MPTTRRSPALHDHPHRHRAYWPTIVGLARHQMVGPSAGSWGCAVLPVPSQPVAVRGIGAEHAAVHRRDLALVVGAIGVDGGHGARGYPSRSRTSTYSTLPTTTSWINGMSRSQRTTDAGARRNVPSPGGPRDDGQPACRMCARRWGSAPSRAGRRASAGPAGELDERVLVLRLCSVHGAWRASQTKMPNDRRRPSSRCNGIGTTSLGSVRPRTRGRAPSTGTSAARFSTWPVRACRATRRPRAR